MFTCKIISQHINKEIIIISQELYIYKIESRKTLRAHLTINFRQLLDSLTMRSFAAS